MLREAAKEKGKKKYQTPLHRWVSWVWSVHFHFPSISISMMPLPLTLSFLYFPFRSGLLPHSIHPSVPLQPIPSVRVFHPCLCPAPIFLSFLFVCWGNAVLWRRRLLCTLRDRKERKKASGEIYIFCFQFNSIQFVRESWREKSIEATDSSSPFLLALIRF